MSFVGELTSLGGESVSAVFYRIWTLYLCVGDCTRMLRLCAYVGSHARVSVEQKSNNA